MERSVAPVIQAGRKITEEELQEICATVEMFPRLDRTELACTLCEHLEWFTASGAPKVDACRKLLMRMEAQGMVRLPALVERMGKKSRGKRKTVEMSERTNKEAPVNGLLSAYKPISVEPVVDREEIGLWNEYMERYHPLGYKQPFGYRLRYFVRSGKRILGCLLLSGAAKSMGVRDKWIGWNDDRRLENLGWVVNNSRFFVLPWVDLPHLASHTLGKLSRRVGSDYKELWGFRPLLMETYVDPARYKGTCYRAAGWLELGKTTGEGLRRMGKTYETTPKLLFVKPLDKDFKRQLCRQNLKGEAK